MEPALKLFLVLLGANPKDRIVEQHDYFFGIASSLKELVPAIKASWPEAGNTIHIDGWREVNVVENYKVKIVMKNGSIPRSSKRLFFINLGGYQASDLKETHHIMLTVQDDRLPAIKKSMKSHFYKTNSAKGAHAHIDEKFGVDVDDVYRIEDVLSAGMKEKYHILLTAVEEAGEDIINLGYFKLDKII